MKTHPSLPIAAGQSRAARFQLGLTQAEVINDSGLSGYKLKQFETGRFTPDTPYLESLRDYYHSKGVDLSDNSVSGTADSPAHDQTGANSIIRHVQRPCFYVSDAISPELLDQCLDRMSANDERIGQLLSTSIRSGILGGYNDQTVQEHQELFGAMAEGYLIFRLLQGNPVVAPVTGATNPATHADLLGQFCANSPVLKTNMQTTEGDAQ